MTGPWNTGEMRVLVPVAGLLVLAFIGYIKGAPLISASPIDLTLVGAAIVSGTLLLRAPEVLRMRGLAPLVLLYIALLIGAVPSGPATDYSSTKVLQIAALVPLCLLGGRAILGTERARGMWLRGIVALGIIIAALAFAFPDDVAAESGRVSIEGGNTIGAGRGVGAAVTVLAIWALHGTRRRVTSIAVAAGLVLVLLLIGSRGPILAVAAAITAATLLSRQPEKPTRMLLAGLGIVAAAWFAITRSDTLSARLFTLQDNSSDARRYIWAETLDTARENPLGIGWGQLYAYMRPGYMLDSGVTQYPHNLVLEILVEAGWVPAVIVVGVIGYVLVLQRRATVTTTETAMLALLVFALVSAMVSGDVPSNREVWVAVGAASVWAGQVIEAPRPTGPAAERTRYLPASLRSGLRRSSR